MTERRCLVRTFRHGLLLLAGADAEISPTSLVADQPVLLDWEGRTVVGFVAIGPDLLRDSADHAPAAWILAVGYGASDLVAVIAAENAAALSAGRDLLGEAADLRDAAWHLDHGRLTFSLAAKPSAGAEGWRERLAERFKAEIRFTWPGGEDPLDLGSAPE